MAFHRRVMSRIQPVRSTLCCLVVMQVRFDQQSCSSPVALRIESISMLVVSPTRGPAMRSVVVILIVIVEAECETFEQMF
jgi:hypothetical protein